MRRSPLCELEVVCVDPVVDDEEEDEDEELDKELGELSVVEPVEELV